MLSFKIYRLWNCYTFSLFCFYNPFLVIFDMGPCLPPSESQGEMALDPSVGGEKSTHQNIFWVIQPIEQVVVTLKLCLW